MEESRQRSVLDRVPLPLLMFATVIVTLGSAFLQSLLAMTVGLLVAAVLWAAVIVVVMRRFKEL